MSLFLVACQSIRPSSAAPPSSKHSIKSNHASERKRLVFIGELGFLTACLAAGSAHVTSLELFADLTHLARTHLEAHGVRNVELLTADALQADAPPELRGSASSPSGPAGFDAIAITGSLPVYDDRFQRQLAVGGRLFVVVGDAPVMDARLIRRVSEESWVTESLFETVVDPLINARRPAGFAF